MVYISNNDLHIVTEKKMVGASDTIIEILFPSTSDNDKICKKAVYEQFGVKKFWIADPTHLYVDQFVLAVQQSYLRKFPKK